MPSFLAYRHGLRSHLGSPFSKNDGPVPAAILDQKFDFPFCPKTAQKGPPGPRGALGALGGPWGPFVLLFFPLFPPCGGPYFSFYAAALWGAPPVHVSVGALHSLSRSAELSSCKLRHNNFRWLSPEDQARPDIVKYHGPLTTSWN